MQLEQAEPNSQDRHKAAEELARLVNDHLLNGFGDEDGCAIKIESREMRRFIKDHWSALSRYAHLIHGS